LGTPPRRVANMNVPRLSTIAQIIDNLEGNT